MAAVLANGSLTFLVTSPRAKPNSELQTVLYSALTGTSGCTHLGTHRGAIEHRKQQQRNKIRNKETKQEALMKRKGSPKEQENDFKCGKHWIW